MTCRIGMSSEPQERIDYWRRQCSRKFSHQILASGLTYEEAQAMEEREARKCGPACEHAPGGKRVPGRVYSVYRVDCN